MRGGLAIAPRITSQRIGASMNVIRVAQVRVGQDWVTVKKFEVQESGWLHYELFDGTIGLAAPKNWRAKLRSVARGV